MLSLKVWVILHFSTLFALYLFLKRTWPEMSNSFPWWSKTLGKLSSSSMVLCPSSRPVSRCLACWTMCSSFWIWMKFSIFPISWDLLHKLKTISSLNLRWSISRALISVMYSSSNFLLEITGGLISQKTILVLLLFLFDF